MSEEAEEHVLLRITYLLACLLHTIITIRVVSNAGLSRSVRMSLNVISFGQFCIWIWIIGLIANHLTDISAMDSFICLFVEITYSCLFRCVRIFLLNNIS